MTSMKKLLAILVLALFSAGLAAAAESPMFAKVVSVHNVVSHQKGYKVTYYTGHGDPKVIYIPMEWFYQTSEYKNADGFVKAEIVRGKGPSYPLLQIFWKDGKFHHLRLFVVDNYSDPTWGVVGLKDDMAAKFDPTKVPDFQF